MLKFLTASTGGRVHTSHCLLREGENLYEAIVDTHARLPHFLKRTCPILVLHVHQSDNTEPTITAGGGWSLFRVGMLQRDALETVSNMALKPKH